MFLPFLLSQVNFSDDSDLDDLVSAETQLVEEPERRGTASHTRGQTRKGPSLKTDAVVAVGSTPDDSSLSGRTRRARRVPSRDCVRASLGPEIMRSIPEEEPMDNQLEKSFEILRGSDGEDSASGGLQGREAEGMHSAVFVRCPWDQNLRNDSTSAQKENPLLAVGEEA